MLFGNPFLSVWCMWWLKFRTTMKERPLRCRCICNWPLWWKRWTTSLHRSNINTERKVFLKWQTLSAAFWPTNNVCYRSKQCMLAQHILMISNVLLAIFLNRQRKLFSAMSTNNFSTNSLIFAVKISFLSVVYNLDAFFSEIHNLSALNTGFEDDYIIFIWMRNGKF